MAASAGAKTILWTTSDRYDLGSFASKQTQEQYRDNINVWIRQQIANTNVVGIVDDAALYPYASGPGSPYQPDGIHFATPVYQEFAYHWLQVVNNHSLLRVEEDLAVNSLTSWGQLDAYGGIIVQDGGIILAGAKGYVVTSQEVEAAGGYAGSSGNNPAIMPNGMASQADAGATIGSTGWTNNLGANAEVSIASGIGVVEYNRSGTPEWTNTFTTPFQFRVQAGGWFDGTSILPIGQAWAW
jgi:hypothetical protein